MSYSPRSVPVGRTIPDPAGALVGTAESADSELFGCGGGEVSSWLPGEAGRSGRVNANAPSLMQLAGKPLSSSRTLAPSGRTLAFSCSVAVKN